MTPSRYETDFGPVTVGPIEETIFTKAQWAREMGATSCNWLLEAEDKLTRHLNDIGKRLHGFD